MSSYSMFLQLQCTPLDRTLFVAVRGLSTVKISVCILVSLRCFTTEYLSGDQIKKTVMGRAYSAYGRRVLVEKPGGRDNLENLGVDGRIILKSISEKWEGGFDWIDQAQDRDRRRAVVNVVKKVRGIPSYGSLFSMESLISTADVKLFKMVTVTSLRKIHVAGK